MTVRRGFAAGLVHRTLVVSVIAFAATLASPTAHHRFGDTYVEGREITIDGQVSQWMFRDPHSYLHVLVERDGVAPERWIVECRGAAHLGRQGVTRETLKPGQRVIVTGNPGRIPSDHRILLRRIVRPEDGWKWRERTD